MLGPSKLNCIHKSEISNGFVFVSDVIAAGETQIRQTRTPVIYVIDLLDWAVGGPGPAAPSKVAYKLEPAKR